MNRKLISRLLVLFLLFAFVWGGTIAQEQQAQTVARLSARSGPGVEFNRLEVLPDGTSVTLLTRNTAGDWVKVRRVDTGITAWVAGSYLSLPEGFDVMSLPVDESEVTSADAAPPADTAQETTAASGGGQTISNLNVRSGAGSNYDAFSRIPARTRVLIEGRNTVGDWVLVRTTGGDIRGWVAARYVNLDDDVSIHLVPVTSEIIGQQPSSPAPDEPDAPVDDLALPEFDAGNLPQGDTNQLIASLSSVPVFHNFNTAQVRTIFRRGQQMGNRPNVFMKVGDSVTAAQPFFTAYGEGINYDLGNYGYLQETIDYFSVAVPRSGVRNSFTNSSFSAFTGATSAAIQDGLWADPTFCQNETPLTCEIKLTRPGVGLVLFGTQDMRIIAPYEFQSYMSELVEEMMSYGVIPVLSTFHNNPRYYGGEALIYNNIIVDIANHYGIPLINLWSATQPLPDNGVNLDDPVHLSQGEDDFFNFTGDETIYGVNLRNLLSLQALDELRKNVLQG